MKMNVSDVSNVIGVQPVICPACQRGRLCDSSPQAVRLVTTQANVYCAWVNRLEMKCPKCGAIAAIQLG